MKFVANASVLLAYLSLIPVKIEKIYEKKTEKYFLKDKKILKDMSISKDMSQLKMFHLS